MDGLGRRLRLSLIFFYFFFSLLLRCFWKFRPFGRIIGHSGVPVRSFFVHPYHRLAYLPRKGIDSAHLHGFSFVCRLVMEGGLWASLLSSMLQVDSPVALRVGLCTPSMTIRPGLKTDKRVREAKKSCGWVSRE